MRQWFQQPQPISRKHKALWIPINYFTCLASAENFPFQHLMKQHTVACPNKTKFSGSHQLVQASVFQHFKQIKQFSLNSFKVLNSVFFRILNIQFLNIYRAKQAVMVILFFCPRSHLMGRQLALQTYCNRKNAEINNKISDLLTTCQRQQVSRKLLLFAGLADVCYVGEEMVMVRFVNGLAQLIRVLEETDEDFQTV